MGTTKEKAQIRFKFHNLIESFFLPMVMLSSSLLFFGEGKGISIYGRLIPLAVIIFWYFVYLMTHGVQNPEMETDNKLQDIEVTVDTIRERLISVSEKAEQLLLGIRDQQELVRSIGDEFHSHLWLVNAGVDVASIPMIRFVPVRIYLSEHP